MITGGEMPGGRMRSTVPLIALICAIAAPMSMPGWKIDLDEADAGDAVRLDALDAVHRGRVGALRDDDDPALHLLGRRGRSTASRRTRPGCRSSGRSRRSSAWRRARPSNSTSSDSTATVYGRRKASRTNSIISGVPYPGRPGGAVRTPCEWRFVEVATVAPATRSGLVRVDDDNAWRHGTVTHGVADFPRRCVQYVLGMPRTCSPM